MIIGELNSKVTSGLRSLPSWDFKVAIISAILVATSSTLLAAYNIGYVKGQDGFEAMSKIACSPGIYMNGDFLYKLNALHISITAGLIISAIGLWVRKAFSFLLSIIALVWICIIYIWWYLDTLHFIKNTEATEYTKLHDPFFHRMGMLYGATPWDTLVLVVVVILFLWQARILIKILRLSYQG